MVLGDRTSRSSHFHTRTGGTAGLDRVKLDGRPGEFVAPPDGLHHATRQNIASAFPAGM